MESFTSNAAELAARLGHFAARVGNPQPALQRMRALLAAGEEEVFASQGAAIGVHWAAPAEAGRKTNPQLLVHTGALRGSLTAEVGEVTETTLRFGSHVPYARFHQLGTRRMPARPFMGIPPDVDMGVTDLLATMIEEAE
jgi:phage gpG-like protein